jgi:CheY-like chemotaxis protein
MDCQMPEMDGFGAAMEIRRHGPNQRTPIVALTANVLEEDRKRCFAAGMNDYLAKPIRKNNLIEAIQKWGGQTIGGCGEHKNAVLASPLSSSPGSAE